MVFSQHGWLRGPIWQSPAIFLQHSISDFVIAEVGMQARAGAAIHTRINMLDSAARHFAMTGCYTAPTYIGKTLDE